MNYWDFAAECDRGLETAANFQIEQIIRVFAMTKYNGMSSPQSLTEALQQKVTEGKKEMHTQQSANSQCLVSVQPGLLLTGWLAPGQPLTLQKVSRSK